MVRGENMVNGIQDVIMIYFTPNCKRLDFQHLNQSFYDPYTFIFSSILFVQILLFTSQVCMTPPHPTIILEKLGYYLAWITGASSKLFISKQHPINIPTESTFSLPHNSIFHILLLLKGKRSSMTRKGDRARKYEWGR